MMTFSMTLTDPNLVFKVMAYLMSIISKWQRDKVTIEHTVYRMVPISMPLTDP